MHATCPECGLLFEREPGYFVGAMYISYGLAVPTLFLLWLAARFGIDGVGNGLAVIIAGVAFLPMVPVIFRTSRARWMHLDRVIDPDK